MAAPADRTNSLAYWNAINSADFQRRCTMQFIIASVAVTTEDSTTPSHTERLALAGQLLAGQFSGPTAATWIMENTTIQQDVLTDDSNGAPIGTSVNDSDILFQVDSIFTGLAISLPSTAQSPI